MNETQQHDHCWHDTGQMLLSNPPQREEVCCWCGEKQRTQMLKYPPAGIHGSHVPDAVKITAVGGNANIRVSAYPDPKGSGRLEFRTEKAMIINGTTQKQAPSEMLTMPSAHDHGNCELCDWMERQLREAKDNQAAMIEEMTKIAAHVGREGDWFEISDDVLELKQRAKVAEVDAQRYRWLELNMRIAKADQNGVRHYIDVPFARSMDEAIDKARQG